MNRSWLAGLLLPLILLLAVSCAPLEIAAAAPTSTPSGFMPPTADTPEPPRTPAATPPPGTAGPTITEILYEEISYDGASILWRTSVPTIGRVEYGRTSTYDQATPWSTTYSLFGGAILGPWEPMQPLWTRVRVKDAAGNETVSKGQIIFSWPVRGDSPWEIMAAPLPTPLP